MAQFTYNDSQLVALGEAAVLNTSIPCNKGYIYHQNESSIVTLRGIVNNPCACSARYRVTANANIAIPEGGTPGPIAIALAISGEAKPVSKAVVTPTAAEAFFNVTSTDIIDVPRGCCFELSLEAVNGSTDPTVAGAPFIEIRNLNIDITRVA